MFVSFSRQRVADGHRPRLSVSAEHVVSPKTAPGEDGATKQAMDGDCMLDMAGVDGASVPHDCDGVLRGRRAAEASGTPSRIGSVVERIGNPKRGI